MALIFKIFERQCFLSAPWIYHTRFVAITEIGMLVSALNWWIMHGWMGICKTQCFQQGCCSLFLCTGCPSKKTKVKTCDLVQNSLQFVLFRLFVIGIWQSKKAMGVSKKCININITWYHNRTCPKLRPITALTFWAHNLQSVSGLRMDLTDIAPGLLFISILRTSYHPPSDEKTVDITYRRHSQPLPSLPKSMRLVLFCTCWGSAFTSRWQGDHPSGIAARVFAARARVAGNGKGSWRWKQSSQTLWSSRVS